jgi:hypothetical protein
MRTLSLAVALAVAAPAAAQEDAPAVVKKAIAAHGGADALNRTRVARTAGTGTMTLNGLKIDFTATSVFSGYDRFRLEMNAQVAGLKLTAVQVLNGKKVKVKSTLGGQDQKVEEKVKEETVQAGLLQEVTTLTPLVETKKYTLKAEPDAKVGDAPAAVVLVAGNGLRDTRLFFDKATGRLAKTQRKGLAAGGAEVNEETVLSDYKPVDKALLPMKSVVTHDGKEFMTLVIGEWKLVDKVDDAEFKTDD